jgi:hypothetical protein
MSSVFMILATVRKRPGFVSQECFPLRPADWPSPLGPLSILRKGRGIGSTTLLKNNRTETRRL